MASVGKLDRRAKAAMLGLVAVIFGMLALIVRTAIVAVTPESLVAAPTSQSQDEIIQLGRHTVLLQHGSVGSRIAHWVHAGSRGSRAFEVTDRLFAPNSDALTSEGETKVSRFSDMLGQMQALHARILVSTLKGDARLSQLRAQRLRAELIKDGIPASRVEVSPEPIKGGAGLSSKPELVVILSS